MTTIDGMEWCYTCDDFMRGEHPHDARRPSRPSVQERKAMALVEITNANELKGFARECKDMIQIALEAGCTARMSSNSHAILRNKAGGTMSVSRKGNPANRGMQNMRTNFNRFMAEHVSTDLTVTRIPPPEKPSPRTMTFKEALADNEVGPFASAFMDRNKDMSPDEPVIVGVDEHGKIQVFRQTKTATAMGAVKVSDVIFECPVCKGREFQEMKALEKHIADEGHVQCDLQLDSGDPCRKWLKNNRAKGPHRSIDHGSNKPWEHRKTWQKKHPVEETAVKAPEEKAASTPPKVEKVHVEEKIQPVSTPPTPSEVPSAAEAVARLNLIRELLGEDTRLVELQQRLQTAEAALRDAEVDLRKATEEIKVLKTGKSLVEAELAELKTKFDLAREAFGL